MSFPFPQLLAFLKEQKDQVEFMKIAAEVGLGSGDIELAKLLLALQLYKAFYAQIPREIQAVQRQAVNDFDRLRAEVQGLADKAAADAGRIGQKAEEIRRALDHIDPSAVARDLHRRLLDSTLSQVGGSLQVLRSAYAEIDTATARMNAAAYQASIAIEKWEAVSLRRVWGCAFATCLVLAAAIAGGAWVLFLRH